MIVPARQLASAAGVPEHVAVIMDGNGRWAKNRSLPRRIGHRYGITPVRTTVEYCANLGVRYLTLFAFSSENWGRPREEVNSLMSLFVDALNREVAELDARNIRLRFMGENRRLGPALREAMRVAEIRTRANTSLELTVAVAYGGRADLVNAARKLARQAAAGKLDPEQIDMDRFAGERGDGANSGCRSVDSHGRRPASQQFPALEPRLQRAVFLRCPLAGLYRRGVG